MGVLSGISKEEIKGAGGIRRVWLAMHTALTGYSVTEATGEANFSSAAGAFKEFVLGKESGSNFAETGTGNPGAGSIQYEQILTAIFKKNQVSKRNEMKVLGEELTVAIIEDNNGEIFLYGGENGMDMTSGVRASGSQYAESNNMTVTLRGLERVPAPAVSDADYSLIKSGTAVL